MTEYKVNIAWDDEAGVWIAESADLRGLILESGSLDVLIERARIAAAELLEIEKNYGDAPFLNFSAGK